jgi:membrane fusion protein, copper/silver efflux system
MAMKSETVKRRNSWLKFGYVILLLFTFFPITETPTSYAFAQEKEHEVWTCGMHPQVIQDTPGTCPICHMKLTPLKTGAKSDQKAEKERKIKYWWDPMLGTGSISDKPGKSAMGMDLVPVYEDEISGGMSVTIDPVVVQNMGVRVAEVTRGPVVQTLRLVGYLNEAQPKVHDVNLRVSGWIEKLYADTEGVEVSVGDPLFKLYSPELQVAVEEFIAARKLNVPLGTDERSSSTRSSNALLVSAKSKLEKWGLDDKEIKRLSELDQAPRSVTFVSPASGHITQKNIVEGAAVKAGDQALRIVDHSLLWLDAQVYEQDLPFVQHGQKISATFESLPGKQFEGVVTFIHPHIDPMTRTATVRMTVPNPDMTLRPGMYATATLTATSSKDALLIPREALIDTGVRKVVFVSEGDGRFTPRSIKAGSSTTEGMVQVLEGLVAGETVVTSGQFLLDAESRMKEAIQKHLDAKLLTTKKTEGHQ